MDKKRRTVFMEKEWEKVERLMARYGLSLSATLRLIVNRFEEQQTSDQDKKEDEKTKQTTPA